MSTTRPTDASRSSPSPISVWDISEIVAEIMKHNSDSPRALAACAAVSHSFSEPALEVLWETMEGLSPLLAILGKSFQIIPGQRSVWKMTFILSAPIDDQEWGRFVRYAKLVRVYVNRGDNIDGLSSGVLMAKTQGEPLLPRLHDLTWVRPIKHSSSLPLFLSPNLHTLYLDLSHDLNIERLRREENEELPDYGIYAGGVTLQAVVSRAPHIQDLTVHDATSPFSLDAISTFPRLRVLKLHLVSDLLSLSSCLKPLVRLEKLTVGMKHEATGNQLDNLPLDSAPLFLEELRTLHLIGPPRFVVAFLDHVRSPVLQHLDLSTACDNALWRRCMRITSSLFSNTLLSLEVWLHDTPTDTSVRRFRDLFSPLYPLRTLQKLNIKELRQIECLITSEDVSDIAKAWPDLRFLALPWSKPDGGGRATLTLPITALDSIARTCLSLKTLVLPLPDPSPLSNSELPSGFQYVNNVTELQLRGGRWKRKARDQCTRYLTHIFPRLESEAIWLDADYEAIFSWHRR